MTYFFDGDEQGLEAFSNLVTAGSRGLLVTRRYPERLPEAVRSLPIQVVWLTREKSHTTALGSSSISVLGGVVMGFLNRGAGAAVFLDGVDYLVTNNGFDRTIRFIYDLEDRVASTGSILITVVPPGCFDARQLALLRRHGKRVS